MSRNPPGSASNPQLGNLEQETELWHFIKLARPEWSKPRKTGHSNAAVVLSKLRAIGVSDTEDLFTRIDRNTLNEDLRARGFTQISREGIDAMRKRRGFGEILKNVDVPHVRGIGSFESIPQMLSERRLATAPPTLGGPSPKRGGKSESSLQRILAVPEGGLAGGGGLSRSASGAGLTRLDADEMTCSPFRSVPRLRDARQTGRKVRHAAAHHLAPQPPAVPGHAQEGWSRGTTTTQELTATSATLPATAESRPPSRASEAKVVAGGDDFGTTRKPPVGTWGRQTSPAALGGDVSSAPNTSRSTRGRHELGDDVQLHEELSFEEVERLYYEGASMARRSEDRSGACWSCARNKSLGQQGDEMLQEQRALDRRTQLIREANAPESFRDDQGGVQGGRGNFRGHIASKIKARLREESKRDAGRGALVAVDQHCINIRKQLELLAKARNEVRGLRVKVQTAVRGDVVEDEGDKVLDLRG